jgi:orotidine-5'-phosphate decarboxylase
MDAATNSLAPEKMPAQKRRLLSTKPIPVQERLIVALDTPDIERAKHLVETLGDDVQFYKLGLELFVAGKIAELLDWLGDRGKKTMVDFKFFDIPETVKAAVRQLKGMGADFATVHGNDNILRAACEVKGGVQILAVTVLTSFDQGDLDELGFQGFSVKKLVLSRARRALEIGCDGVISSGEESKDLRDSLGKNFLIVVPGIRPVKNIDDQKRTVNVEQAFERGADYVVVGRPIRLAPDPALAARDFQRRIHQVFESA